MNVNEYALVNNEELSNIKSKLTPRAYVMFFDLAFIASTMQDSIIRLSREELSLEEFFSKRSVSVNLKELIANGLVREVQGGFMLNPNYIQFNSSSPRECVIEDWNNMKLITKKVWKI